MILEEFQKSISIVIRLYLEDHKVSKVREAAVLADGYDI